MFADTATKTRLNYAGADEHVTCTPTISYATWQLGTVDPGQYGIKRIGCNTAAKTDITQASPDWLQ